MALLNFTNDLIKLLGGEARFGNYVAGDLREAVIEYTVISDRDHVTDLIPVEVGVEGIRREGALLIP